MNKLIQYFIKRSFIVNLICVFIALAGVVSLTSMQRDLIPPFQWQLVNVNVGLPGASPKEIEQFVTFPIEEATRGLRGVERVESTSQTGSSRIRYYFDSGHDDMGEATEVIQARLNSIRSQLPESILSMTVERAQVNEIFLFWLGLENFQEKNPQDRLSVENFSQKLLDIPGVVNVNQGYRKRHLSIEFDPEKLNRAEVSLSRARSIVGEALRVGPIGEAQVEENKYTVTVQRQASDLEGIANLPIRSNRSGQGLLLKDLAKVEYRLEERPAAQYINNKPGSYLVVLKDINSDTIDLKPKVLNVLEEFNQSQKELKAVTLMDGPRFLEQQIDVLMKNGALGLILVVLVLMFFLNIKTAMMTSMGLAVAYTGTFIVLYLAGISIDLLSIIGMILVVGILVDDAIIVAERYVSYLNKGHSPQKAAQQSVQDLIIPVTGTVVTTIVAFAPMIFIESEISHILYAVPLVVIASLVLSWVESFFVLPNHLAHFVKKSHHKSKREVWVDNLKRGYERILSVCLKWRYLVMTTIVAVLVVGGVIGAKHMEHDFNLNINSEYVKVYAVLKESAGPAETYEKIAGIEKYLRSFDSDEVQNVYTDIGSIWMNGKRYEGARYAQINAYLNNDVKYPSELKERIQAQVNKELEKVSNEDFERLYSSIERQGESEEKGQMLSVRIRGGDRISFNDIEERLTGTISELEEVKEYVPNPERFQESWIFVPNLHSLAQYGISSFDLSQQMRGVFAPHLIQETRINGDNIGVYSRVKLDHKLEFSKLSGLEVVSPSGLGVPLEFLGSWKQEKSLKEITHYDGMRNLTMDFSIAEGSNINAALASAQEVIRDLRQEFPSYEITARNANEQEVKSQAWALKVALVCIAGVLLVIALVLGSLTQPLLVGMPIPFALVGVILALFAHGEPLGLMALVGLIGTVGVGVNASIVMVDQINQNTKSSRSRPTRQSILEGASSRFRAILLTTLTTLAGVFPMAYSWGGESGFTQPLAFALGWGVTFSTIMTLFALPALLEIREDLLTLKDKLTNFLLRKRTSKLLDNDPAKEDSQKEKLIIPEPWKNPSLLDDETRPRQ